MTRLLGKEAVLLSPPPLRAARESFDSSRSSLSNALLGMRLRHSSALPSRYASGADEHCGELAASRWSADSLSRQRLHQRSFSVVICFSSLAGLPDSLVRKDRREVCPLSHRVILPKAQLLSVLLQNGIRFLPRPLPVSLSTCLAARLPIGSDTGLLCSAYTPEWVRSSLSADDRLSTTGKA
jgi:hypothetical protein